MKEGKASIGDAESEAGQGAWDGAELCVKLRETEGPAEGAT